MAYFLGWQGSKGIIGVGHCTRKPWETGGVAGAIFWDCRGAAEGNLVLGMDTKFGFDGFNRGRKEVGVVDEKSVNKGSKLVRLAVEEDSDVDRLDFNVSGMVGILKDSCEVLDSGAEDIIEVRMGLVGQTFSCDEGLEGDEGLDGLGAGKNCVEEGAELDDIFGLEDRIVRRLVLEKRNAARTDGGKNIREEVAVLVSVEIEVYFVCGSDLIEGGPSIVGKFS